jgi:hypothetical protein
VNFLIGHDDKEGPSGLESNLKMKRKQSVAEHVSGGSKIDIMVKVHDFTARTLGNHISS